MNLFIRATFLTIIAIPGTCALSQVVVPIHPRGTFIRTSQDSPAAPSVHTLASLGIAPGDLIRIRVLGEFSFGGGEARDTNAVFSSSDTLLASNLQSRVPGALDAGIDLPTGTTYFQQLPTDIPEDFLAANSVTDHGDAIVPAGATHLFIGALDSLYQDNQDLDNDYAAEVTVLCAGGLCCDSVDFNNDTSLFDPQDIDAFLSVYSEGPCVPSTATCNDIDFNNDGSLFDPCDISSFLLMYSEGPCTACGT